MTDFPEGPGSAEAIEFQRQHSPDGNGVRFAVGERVVNANGQYATITGVEQRHCEAAQPTYRLTWEPDGIHDSNIRESALEHAPEEKPVTEPELAPCPFCGESTAGMKESQDTDSALFHFVECEDCAAEGPFHLTEAKAVEAWNRRTPGMRETG